MSFFRPSALVESFEESATLLISARAKRLAAEGRKIVNFGAGEPDFNTPSAFISAAAEAANRGQTKYTAVAGMPSLRQAIAERMSKDYGVSFSEAEVLASCGGKQAIYHFLQATLEPGDEVIILAPYWVSFPEMVKLCRGVPKIVHPTGERILASEIEAQLSSKTKAIIFNSPSNPSGTVFTKEEWESYLEVVGSRPIWILSDDTYYKLIYEPAKFYSVLGLRPQLRERTCIIGSSSKSYAMTGWRVGWAVGPKELISAMNKLQSQVTSSPCSLSQVALEVALREGEGEVENFRATFQARRDRMLKGLQQMSGVRFLRPDGAFYVFADLSKALGVEDVTAFASELLEKEGVCVVPGIAFGDPRSVRLSYAASEADIDEGLRRLSRALK